MQNYADYKRLVKDENGFFVHEHLVREHSSMLANVIDKQKKKGEEKFVIFIRAESTYVSYWIDWLYGQRIFPCWEDVIHDEVLEDFVEMFRLAYSNEDWECINLCLDAIRDLFLEESADLGEPLDKLKPLLDVVDFCEDHETVLDMIAHVVVYGPGADSGQSKIWVKTLADHYPLNDWAKLWQRFGVAFATKAAAQASEEVEDIPDFMAEHAYHLRKPREKLCCGREVSPELVSRKKLAEEHPNKKRKLVEAEEEDED